LGEPAARPTAPTYRGDVVGGVKIRQLVEQRYANTVATQRFLV